MFKRLTITNVQFFKEVEGSWTTAPNQILPLFMVWTAKNPNSQFLSVVRGLSGGLDLHNSLNKLKTGDWFLTKRIASLIIIGYSWQNKLIIAIIIVLTSGWVTSCLRSLFPVLYFVNSLNIGHKEGYECIPYVCCHLYARTFHWWAHCLWHWVTRGPDVCA